MQSNGAASDLARDGLGFLVSGHGFVEVDQTPTSIRFESQAVGVEAFMDPRGELEVSAFRLGHESAADRWRWTGMTGRASMSRLVEIAGEHLCFDPAVLEGNEAFFVTLAERNRASSRAWTEFYSGEGPRPTGKLP